MPNTKTKKHKKLIKKSEDYAKQLELDNILIIKFSSQTIELLNKVAKHGIYGSTPEIVAERFVDHALQNFVQLEEMNVKI